MPQDPLDKYKTGSTIIDEDDPLSKYKSSAIKEEPIKKLESVKFSSNDPLDKYKSNEEPDDSWLHWAFKSLIPDFKKSGINYESKNPQNPGREIIEPDTYIGGFTNSLEKTLYDNTIGAISSPAGIALATVGGPIIRGGAKLASKIPGVAKLAGAELGSAEAPQFVKNIVNEFSPRVATKMETNLSTKVDTLESTEQLPVEVTPLSKLQTALEQQKPLSREQTKILTAERSAKFKEAENVPITSQEDSRKFLSKFAGKHTKVVNEPLALDQPDVDSLFKMIGDNLKAGKISTPESARSIEAFNKLLTGNVLQRNEIEILGRTFGPDIIKNAHTATGRELFLKTVNIPKALVSALDIGFPFRQGFNRIGQKEWFGMLKPSIESYFSKDASEKWMQAIKETRNFDLARTSGLKVYDNIKSFGDEHTLDSFVANIPGIKHSNRAYNIGATKLRMDLFNSLYDDYMRMYTSGKNLAEINPNKLVREELLKKNELFNPENEYVSRKIADLINVSTGRGSIGKAEPIAEELNAVLFSPALMSARIRSLHRVLNPVSYAFKDPIERKDALKQLVSIAGTVLTTGALLKASGAEITLDPRSSDFGKGKIGKFRFDLTGGYPQYIVPAAKILSGQSVSAKTGKMTELNSRPYGQTMFDVGEQFLINKEAPIASILTSYLRGIEPTGKPVNFSSPSPFENTAMRSSFPIMIQDFHDLMQEDPKLLPFMIPGALGASTAVYEDFGSTNQRRRR